jgi:hypothetical protein
MSGKNLRWQRAKTAKPTQFANVCFPRDDLGLRAKAAFEAWRKRQFPKLSNLTRGLAALDQFERTTTKNPSAVAGRGRAVLHGGLKNRNPPGASRAGQLKPPRGR